MKSKVVSGFFKLAVASLAILLGQPVSANVGSFTVVTDTDFASAAVGGLRYTGGAATFSISGLSGTVSSAYLYWHGPLNGADAGTSGQATLNGQSVTGTSIGISGPNCWFTPVLYAASQSYRADVTSIVQGNGNYALTVGAPLAATVNGASLIIFYNDGNAANNRDVYVFDGNDSNAPNVYDSSGWLVSLSGLNYSAGQPGYLQLHVSDAQKTDLALEKFYDDAALELTRTSPGPIQSYVLAASGSVFNGNVGSQGDINNLWDVTTWDIAGVLQAGVNNLSLSTGYIDDCVSLVVAIVDLPRGNPPPPPPPPPGPNNFAPIVTCAQPVALNCTSPGGQVVTLTANVSDADGNPVGVIWSVQAGGNPAVQAKVETIPAGSPTTTGTSSLAYNFVPGSYLVTVSVSDGDSAHDQSCTTTVSVTSQDTLAPVITQCASSLTLVVNSLLGTAILPDLRGGVIALDNCTDVNALVITQNPPAGTVFSLLSLLTGGGSTNVTLSVRDAAGNTTTCVATATLTDLTPPVITQCAPGRKAAPGGGGGGASVPDFTGSVVATDNVTPSGALVITQLPTAGTVVGLGVTTVTITVKDAAGNTSTCGTTFEVTTADITPPTITTCASPVSLAANAITGKAAVPDFLGGVVATDNVAGILVKTQTPAAGALVGVGLTTVTISVADAAGNASTCTVNFTVTDATAPVITGCASTQTLAADATTGKAALPNLAGQVTATDNSGSATVTQSPAAGTLVGVGLTVVTVTATDAAGNSSTCVVNVTVVDQTPPVFNCGSPLFANADSTGKAAVPDATTQIVATDNVTPSGSLIRTQSPAQGVIVGVGPVTITVTIKDAAGNFNTCTVVFTVLDQTAPTIVQCAPNATATAGVSGTVAVPDLRSQLVATDNSGGTLTVTQSPAPGTQVAAGSYPVTFTVADPSGKTATCSATLTVTAGDTVPPTIISCAPAKSVNASATTGKAAVPNFTTSVNAQDNRPGALTITQSPAVGTLVGIGSQTVTITVTDLAGNQATCNTILTVVDVTAPVITTCAPTLTAPLGSNRKGVVPDFTTQVQATDNSGTFTVTQSPTAGTQLSAGTYTVTITVKDAAGNKDTCCTSLKIKDITPPVFTQCAPNITTNLPSGYTKVKIPDLTGAVRVQDESACDVALTQSPVATTRVGAGTYTITFTATDSAGNSSTCTSVFVVTNVDTTAPNITYCAPAKTASADATTGKAAVPNFTSSVTATDNVTPSGSLVITQSPAAGSLASIGITTVTITVADAAGNKDTCTTTFTVNDCTAPVITSCADNATASPTSNGKAAVPNLIPQIEARDNSGAFTVTQSPAAGTLVSCGSTSIKLTVKDASGNYSTCTVTFTVKDLTPPVILTCAPSSSVAANSSGKGYIPNLLSAVTATDDSGSVTLSQSPAAGTCVDVGVYTIVIKAKDGAGNYVTCTASFTVTAQTSSKPSVDCSVSVSSLNNANNELVNVGFSAVGHNYTGAIQVKVYSNLDDVSGSNSRCGGDRDDGDDDDDDYSGKCNYWSKYGDNRSNSYDGYNSCSNYSPDAKNIATGTLRLRAERPGSSTGRVYLIVATVTNSAGKTAFCTSTVVVPNDGTSNCRNLVNQKATQAQAYYTGYGQPPAGYYLVGDGAVVGTKQ